MLKHLLAMAMPFLMVGVASAHAYLDTADPVPNSVLAAPPETVRLTFTEPIEIRFSTLKVYRLELDANALPEDLGEMTERELMRLNALAASLVSEALEAEADETRETRVDSGVLTEARTAAEVTLELKEGLEPGVYVVMWEVLSIDTHWTKAHFLFFIAPEEV